MSRHLIARHPIGVVVGWDPPLQTYFLQIIDPSKPEEEELVLLIGAAPCELPTVESLSAALESHAALASHVALTPEFQQTLEEEKANSPQPTALQQWVIKTFAPRNTE
ncbi:MAG: hypothetical protein MOB07_13115 [Acidobacteria bacterium]|nr:hypothetical protein [Acidobacteriota bacterium]